MLMSVIPNILLEGAEALITILQKVADALDLLGEIGVLKRAIVPGNSTLRVKCTVSIEFGSKQKSALCQPLLEPNVSDILNINERYENLREGKTPHIFITITNPSNKNIVIKKGYILYTLHNFSATIPVTYKKETNVNKISQEKELNQVKRGNR